MKAIANVRFLKMAAFMSLMIIGLSSCKKNEEIVEVKGDSKVKVVNTVSGSNAQDFYQNDKKLSTSPIAYGQSTPYITIDGGIQSTLSLKRENTSETTVSTLAAPQVNRSFTLFYYSNPNGSGSLDGILDDNTVPATGKARVRFLNLASALGSSTINISVAGGNTITTGLAYGNTSIYNTIDANVALNVNIVGLTDFKTIPATEFQSGKIYTIWFDASNATTINYHIVAQN